MGFSEVLIISFVYPDRLSRSWSEYFMTPVSPNERSIFKQRFASIIKLFSGINVVLIKEPSSNSLAFGSSNMQEEKSTPAHESALPLSSKQGTI